MAVLKTEAQPAAKPTRVGLIDRFSVVLIAVAATMWASDTYFRAQLIGHLTPSQIVVIEDALVSLFLVAFLLRGIPEMRRLDRRGWLAIGLVAVGPQAVATILFTTSFSYRHFAETFVLQQTQPLIAIVLAWIILGERRRPWFWPAAALAIVGVYMVVFAQNLMAPFSDLQHGRLEAGLYALGAAALWLQPAALPATIRRHGAADRGHLHPQLDQGTDAAGDRAAGSRRVKPAACWLANRLRHRSGPGAERSRRGAPRSVGRGPRLPLGLDELCRGCWGIRPLPALARSESAAGWH